MNRVFSLVPVSSSVSDDRGFRSRNILFTSFLLGALTGTVGTVRFPVEDFFSFPGFFSGPADFLWLFWAGSWLDLVVVFLGSSLIGFLFLPLVFAVRGFLVSRGVSLLIGSGITPLLAGGLIGLPALFSMTALFFIAEEAFDASLSLYRLGKGLPVRFRFVSSERLICSAWLLFASAAVRQFLIPLLR